MGCKFAVVGIVLALAVAVAACGAAKKKPIAPPRVQVPNVVGEKADPAVHEIERAKLTATLDPEPEDRDLCRVKRQSEIGSVRPNTDVLLTLSCLLDVPDVSGDPAGRARAEIKRAGHVKVSFDPGEPRDLLACTVTHQSSVGRTRPGTDVILSYQCAITREDVRSSAEDLAKHSAKRDEDYRVSGCEVVASDEGQCDVDYTNLNEGYECPGRITVTLNGSTLHAEQKVDCSSLGE